MSEHRFRTAPPPAGDPKRHGWAHQKARNAAKYRHRDTDPCARCGHPLGPMGPHLHYDHTDTGNGYLGFSHGWAPCPRCGRKCNLRAGALAGNAAQRRRGGGTSRDWSGGLSRW